MDWEKNIFSNTLCHEVGVQYKKLLSAGLTSDQAENLIISYLINNDHADAMNQWLMWIALGLSEWKLGRLSETVYQTVITCLENPPESLTAPMIQEIKNTISSSQPETKKIRLAKVTHCPWPVGSLLAYKIATNNICAKSQYWNKYVLLRVVSIKKRPVSYLAPSVRYNESMVVALYPWFGETVPPSSVVEGIEITPISIRKALLSHDILQHILAKTNKNPSFPEELIDNLTSPQSEYFYLLDWESSSKADGKIVFIDCNPDFKIPSSIVFADMDNLVLAGYNAFDICLVKRMESLFG